MVLARVTGGRVVCVVYDAMASRGALATAPRNASIGFTTDTSRAREPPAGGGDGVPLPGGRRRWPARGLARRGRVVPPRLRTRRAVRDAGL